MTLYKSRPPNPNRYPNPTNKLKPNSKSSRFDAKCKSFLRFVASLNDDLIQNTKLTLPTVTKLCLSDVTSSIDFPVLCRVLSLTPNLKHLTVQQRHITVIDNMNNNANVLGHINPLRTSVKLAADSTFFSEHSHID